VPRQSLQTLPKNSSALPDRETALRELLRRQVRAIVGMLIRLVACALLLTFLKPLWARQAWLESPLFALAALLCGVPLLRDVGRNWSWRIALGTAYLNAERLTDAEALLAPLGGVQAQLFDPDQKGAEALAVLRKKRKDLREP
jgi:hypothetical protein